MGAVFKDYFSTRAAAYRHYRPGYPDALYAFLAAQSPRRRLAWDCATGSGQVARGLAPYFPLVVATDASASQLQAAIWHPRVAYRKSLAESTPFATRSVDLVTVAQALHWFAIEQFFGEVRRVLVPGGLIAVWSYGLLSVSPEVDALIRRLYAVTLAGYWPGERRCVENGYADIPFPFDPVPASALSITAWWRCRDLSGYLRTWSAVRAFRSAYGTDPVAQIAPALEAAWAPGGGERSALAAES